MSKYELNEMGFPVRAGLSMIKFSCKDTCKLALPSEDTYKPAPTS